MIYISIIDYYIYTGVKLRIYCWIHSNRINHESLAKLTRYDICDDVFLLVLNSYHAFYKSNIYPSVETHIPLKEIVKTLRNAGINIHAWIITLLRANEYFALKNVDLYHVSKHGKSIVFNPPYRRDYKWLDPANPGVIEHVLKLINEILDLEDYNAIHLDYIRYPDNPLAPGIAKYYGLIYMYSEERDFGYSTVALKSFNEEYGLDPRALEYGTIEYEIWSKWRADRVRKLVYEISKLCRSRGVKVGADVFPTPELGYKHVLQKWDEWKLDLYALMLYHEYWLKPSSWIVDTSIELYAKKLPIVPGIHLNQLQPNDIEYIFSAISKSIGSIAIFVYPPASEIMKQNWEVTISVLRSLGER